MVLDLPRPQLKSSLPSGQKTDKEGRGLQLQRVGKAGNRTFMSRKREAKDAHPPDIVRQTTNENDCKRGAREVLGHLYVPS